MKVIVGRPVEGVALNGDEYLSDENGKAIVFSSQEEALTFMVMVTELDYEQAAGAFNYYEVELPEDELMIEENGFVTFEDFVKETEAIKAAEAAIEEE